MKKDEKSIIVNEQLNKPLFPYKCSFIDSLKNLQEIHYAILNAITHAVIGLKERTIFFANHSVEKVFGWKPDELIGKNTRVLYRSDEDYEEIGKRFYPILEKGKTHVDEFPCIRKDKKEIICRISASIIGEKLLDRGIVVMYEDITDLKNAERDLIKSEKKYREIVENANSIILRCNPDGVITFLNQYGLRFFGYSENEIIGKQVIGTIVPEVESTNRDLRTLIEKIYANPEAFEKNVNENIKKDGSRVWIAWTNKPVFDDNGNLIEVLSIGTDITDSKKKEEDFKKYREHLEDLVKERTQKLQELNRELKQSNEKLKEIDRLKSMFIATMSHELRTPLNSIIGFIGMTLQGLSGELNEEQKDNLRRSYQSAKHLHTLISDIIDISKIEAGKIDSFIEEFFIKDIINVAISTIEPQLKDKGLTLNVDLPLDIIMNTDKKRLLQCLINLLSNAIKYTESGNITIIARKNNNIVELTVKDTGIGISQEDIHKVFKPFERINTHLSVKAGGTGLGLYLTRKIVREILKGDITVESVKGVGSTFTIRIPVKLKNT